jgi:hypothetical protein
MAFNDLFSSAKGPGVIGLIMALIVLLGFGGLSILALEDGAQGGGKSLAAIVRDYEREILEHRSRIEIGDVTLARVPRLKDVSDNLAAAKERNNVLSVGISSMGANADELGKGVATLREEWEDYKNRYRAQVREAAVGTRMPELRTADGKVFKDVEISKVTAIGVDIRHQDGLGRVGFEQLPPELQDLYQFDKAQMLAEASREEEARAGLAQAVAKAQEAAGVVAEGERAKEAEEMRRKLLADIAAKEAQASSIEAQMRQLESDIISAESAASAARASGRMHLNKAGSLRQALNGKRSNLAQLRADIARMRANL